MKIDPIGFDARVGRALWLGWALFLASSHGIAALGQAPTTALVSVDATPVADAKRLSSASNGAVSLYTRHETLLENGTTVREYATPTGVVFAVSWQGPVLPDLRVFLGDYFAAFNAGVAQGRLTGQRGSPVNLARDGLVIHSSGRMRHFWGHAYAPALVPVGVAISDVLQ